MAHDDDDKIRSMINRGRIHTLFTSLVVAPMPIGRCVIKRHSVAKIHGFMIKDGNVFLSVQFAGMPHLEWISTSGCRLAQRVGS